MAEETRRNLHQLLREKHQYSALYGMYRDVLHDFMAILKESAGKGESQDDRY
jgi:hypothetical protein